MVSTIIEEDQLALYAFADKSHSKFHEDILNEYSDKSNEFFMNKIICENENLVISYDWIYLFENNQILVNYNLKTKNWKIISIESDLDFDENQLNLLLDSINQQNQTLSFHEQVQLIQKEFHLFFVQSKSNSSSIIQTPDLPILNPNHHLSTTTTTINRHRLDSNCSSTNSIKYAEFVPPSSQTVRQRRVIQTIQFQVQQKKNFFSKIADGIRNHPIEPILYQLGLHFLRLHDGKFNYPIGHIFIVHFEKRTWFLTITDIKSIPCQLGQPEPRSILIINYKDKFLHVQV